MQNGESGEAETTGGTAKSGVCNKMDQRKPKAILLVEQRE